MTISLHDYQIATRETAIYPEAGEKTPAAMAYCTLGLLNELGEFCEVLESADGSNEELIAESGDVFWYLARVADELGYDLADINEEEVRGVVHDGIVFAHPAHLAGFVKKMMRDGDLTGEKKANARGEVVEFYFEFATGLAQMFGADFIGQALDYNLNKLNSRKERGVLGGSGDHR